MLQIIEAFIEFPREVVRRRIEFELRKAEARAHVLEGLKIALDHLDAVIALIRASRNPVEARDGLMREFGLSQVQSQAILPTCSSSGSRGSSGRRSSTNWPSC